MKTKLYFHVAVMSCILSVSTTVLNSLVNIYGAPGVGLVAIVLAVFLLALHGATTSSKSLLTIMNVYFFGTFGIVVVVMINLMLQFFQHDHFDWNEKNGCIFLMTMVALFVSMIVAYCLSGKSIIPDEESSPN